MSRPFISVIIPTCNREQYAMECLASILQQAYSDFEVLLIDQDPQRSVKRLLTCLYPDEPKVRYFYLERAGAARARNFGVENARGPVVAFIDDDAIAAPAWLEAIAEVFSIVPRPTLMGGRIEPIWLSKKPVWYPAEREFLLGLYDVGGQIRPMPDHDLPIAANMAGWREDLLTQGGFEETLGPNYFRARPMVTGEETMLGKRIRRTGRLVYYQPKALVRHRISKAKLTPAYFLKRHFWEGVTVLEEMALLGEIGVNRWPHLKYHAREAALAFARFLVPGYENRYPYPAPVIRMLALARIAYSFGVLYRLRDLPQT